MSRLHAFALLLALAGSSLLPALAAAQAARPAAPGSSRIAPLDDVTYGRVDQATVRVFAVRGVRATEVAGQRVRRDCETPSHLSSQAQGS